MTTAIKTVTRGAVKEKFNFILFVAGQEPNSMLARQNLESLCKEQLPGRHVIEVVDVCKNLDLALKHHILITPTLIKIAPNPPATIFGNLSDSRKVMATLQI